MENHGQYEYLTNMFLLFGIKVTWSIPTSSQVDWQLTNGDPSNANRPQVDHT